MRVGIVGVGGMGSNHARQYGKMPDVEIGGLDLDPNSLANFAKTNDAPTFGSVAELIAWADVVDVCTPTDSHVPLALEVIASGKPVFVEKPVARNLTDGVALAEAADKAGVPIMVGQVVRFFPDFANGHRIVVNGGIGTPAAARTRRGGKAPSGNQGWFMDHERSGGVILDLAIHDFDWLRWTFGEVSHLYSRSVASKSLSGPDYSLTVLTFDSGVIGHVEGTWMDPSGFRTAYEVAGSDGLVSYDSRMTPSLRTHTESGSTSETNLGPFDDPYYLELRGFLDAVKNGTEPPVTIHDGLMALSIGLAAYESAKTGKVVAPTRI